MQSSLKIGVGRMIRLKINTGAILLILSIIMQLSGNPYWFKWWVYIIALFINFNLSGGRE